MKTKDQHGNEYVGAVQQWLNPDRSVSYLKYVYLWNPSQRQIEVLFGKMAVGWPIVDVKNKKPSPEKTITTDIIFDEEKRKLLREWQATGTIPDKLQDELLVPYMKDGANYLSIP